MAFVQNQTAWEVNNRRRGEPASIGSCLRNLDLFEREQLGRVRQRGVNSVVASGLHFQAAFGVICSG